MASSVYDEAILEAIEYADPATTFYDTIEIDCADFTESIKIVNDEIQLSTNQGIFIPCRFGITLPGEEPSVRGELKLNVNFLPKAAQVKIKDAVLASGPITIKFRGYTAEDSDPTEEIPVLLEISSVEQTPTGVSISAMFPDLVNMKFPKRLMTTTILPGGIV